MKAIDHLLAAIAKADPVTDLVVLTLAFLFVFHAALSRAFRIIERLVRRRGEP